MAKRRKVLPARKPHDRSRDDDALLIRSAESLGRMIGALQRQLDEATRRLIGKDGAVHDGDGTGHRGARTATPSRRANGKNAAASRTKTAAARKSSGAKVKRAMVASHKRRSGSKARKGAKPR
jgi:hypothetical protein